MNDALPCADTVGSIPHASATQGSQTSLGHHLGHSHGNFRSDLHVQCAATRSFVHDNTQMLHVLYAMGAIHLPSP